MPTIILPDGNNLEFPKKVTGLEVAEKISKSLAKQAMVISVDGELKDLDFVIEKNCSVKIFTSKNEEGLETIRHDTAHILAMAVQEIFPGTQVTIGPTIENGFYYDFARKEPFTEEDLKKIEEKMKEIVDRDEKTKREVWDRDKAIKHFKKKGEIYKAELIESIPKGEEVSIYFHGEWHDLCRGPHLSSTGKIGKFFKLMKVSGAYWRGDEKRPMLTRIYGITFPKMKLLKEYLAMMEEARAVSILAKQGHAPKRTLMYCAWGAEEPGLIGSTEWVETHAKELSEKVVAYINTDGTGTGFLNAGGSHTLEKFFNEITHVVDDPQKKVSVFDRRNAVNIANAQPSWPYYKLSALGSGSDYSPFFQHLGISSFNMGFGGESSGGEYHTMYDSYKLYKRFKDPTFQYGVALAKVAGRTSLRLANAEILPFEFSHFSNIVSKYADEVKKLADQLRKDAENHNKLIENGIYDLVSNPKDNFKKPVPKITVPYFNFAPIENALKELKTNASIFSMASKEGIKNTANTNTLNKVLKNMESKLTRSHGLPRRSWYKHHIYAPGFYTGYGVKTLPGVREAIEQKNFKEVTAQIAILTEVLNGFNSSIIEAVKLMK